MNKKKKKQKSEPKGKSHGREILGILLFSVSLVIFLALVSHDASDWPASSKQFGEPSHNLTGRYGAFVSHSILEYVGLSGYFFVILMVVCSVIVFMHRPMKRLVRPAIFLIMFGIFLPLFASLITGAGESSTIPDAGSSYGGILGVFLSFLFVTYIGRIGAALIVIALLLVTVVITTGLKPSSMVDVFYRRASAMYGSLAANLRERKRESSRRSRKKTAGSRRAVAGHDDVGYEDEEKDESDMPFITPVDDAGVYGEKPLEPTIALNESRRHTLERLGDTGQDDEADEDVEDRDDTGDDGMGDDEDGIASGHADIGEDYVLPDNDLLDEPLDEPVAETREEMLDKSRHIVECLRHFNIESEVRQITPGPIVTRYELTIAPGVKIGRVVNLSDDLALTLKSRGGIRILAPIPGKAAIGIEVPNNRRATVYFREIAESEAFNEADKPLILALGKTAAGEPAVADLAKMPHLLIAGSTGSGKSVCINTIIASILMKASPEKVRMIMIDPKVVELAIYNDIPHLLTPVVTDPARAEDALKWAVREMEKRYRKLASHGVRDIAQYNAKVAAEIADYDAEALDADENDDIPEELPFIVVIIDEFADLMMLSSSEVEDHIARLAQMARAVGIHLVLATQRPSSDVITGLIKANFPSRIAFKVMQASNSRIILDQNGADKLLGMGDMLFLQVGKPESVRLHGAFITNDESVRLTSFVAAQRKGAHSHVTDDMFREEDAGINNTLGLRDPGDRDPLFFKAARLVVRNDQGSVSLLQRRLKVGYARAARLIDQLELAGIVGPYDGSKAREVMADELYLDDLEAEEME